MHKHYIIVFVLLLLTVSVYGCTAPTATAPVIASLLPPTPSASAQSTYLAVQEDEKIRSKDGMTMIFVPGGAFEMGSTEIEVEEAIQLCREHYNPCNNWYYQRESPLHTVELGDYWIDQSEVTNDQYRMCVESGACNAPLECTKGLTTYQDPEKGDHPVVCVDWHEAQTYCQWAGSRLPTEAEWEYAARGEERLIFPWGNEFDGGRLNYCDASCDRPIADERFDDGYPLTAPVDAFPEGRSWVGAWGMGGNVSEWIWDWLGDYSPDNVSNPTGPPSGSEKILRGGSWHGHPTYCRTAIRASVNPETKFENLGFRCAAPVESPTASQATIGVPQVNSAAIDGLIAPGEWDGALIETFSDGSELLLMYSDGYLYLGIRARSPEMIGANVYLDRDGEITILHVSAALGTAIYEARPDIWLLTQDFDWRLRNTSDSPSAQAERAAFLEEEGWLAANSYMGAPNELEYQIEMTGDTQRLAVTFLIATPPNEKFPWPIGLDDDCVKPTPSGLPQELFFSPEKWAVISIIP